MNKLVMPIFEKRGYKSPSLIQTLADEAIASSDDIALVSPTGSGKTLAFGIPALTKMTPGEGTQLIIIEPTQELAIQVKNELNEFAMAMDLKMAVLIGNANVKRQIEKLKLKPEIVIGTPGRLIELLNKRKLKANKVKIVILDEVDDLLGDKLVSKTRDLIDKLPRDYQLVTAAATPKNYEALLHQWLGRSVKLLDATANDNSQGIIKQQFLIGGKNNLTTMLIHFIHQTKDKTLVFFNNQAELAQVLNILRSQHMSVGMLAANQSKFKRQEALESFKRGDSKVMLATDLGTRGIDIPDLKKIVNFHLPSKPETYLNRIGRTGRMGKNGAVINFITEGEKKNFNEIVNKPDDLFEVFLNDGKISKARPINK